MKFNPIFAILGFIFGVVGGFIAYFLSGFDSELMTNGSIALISGILGLIGIWLFNRDYRVAIAQYTIAGIGVLIGVSLYGVVGCIFYVLAAVVALMEKDKVKPIISQTNNIHYFGNKDNIPQVPVIKSDSRLWIIPLVSFIVILLVGIGGNISHDMEISQKASSLEVSNVAIESEGYSMYKVSCDLKSSMNYKYLQMEVIFYDSNNAIIGKSPLVWNMNNPQKDQIIKVSGTAMTSNSKNVPVRAELYFYDDALNSNPNDAIYVHNVTIN